MFKRRMLPKLQARLDRVPAVALLGPRQVGKTTLALEVAAARPSIYLDLESDADRARLTDPESYLAGHAERLVILDEVEVKRSASPKVSRGFHQACADLRPERRFVVYPGRDPFSLGDDVSAIGLDALAAMLAAE